MHTMKICYMLACKPQRVSKDQKVHILHPPSFRKLLSLVFILGSTESNPILRIIFDKINLGGGRAILSDLVHMVDQI